MDASKWNDYMTSIAAHGRPWNAYKADGAIGDAIGPPGGYNAETDSPSLVRVDNGLWLGAHPGSSIPGYSYTGSVVDTYGKFAWSGGYFQARVKMPDVSTGYWPAIWFLPAAGAGTGDDAGEFDVQEGGYVGAGPVNDTLTSTLHLPNGSDQRRINTGLDLSGSFHTYGARYVPGRSLAVYLDGRQMARFTRDVPTWPLQLIIDLSVASSRTRSWHTTGSPTSSGMQISEVQFYSRP